MTQEKRAYTLGGVFQPQAKTEIESTLAEMKSIAHVNVDLSNNQVNFSFDPQQIEEEFIQNTLNSLGYSVRNT